MLVLDIVLLSDVILNAVSAKIVIHFLTTIHYVREVSSLIHIQSDFKCIIDWLALEEVIKLHSDYESLMWSKSAKRFPDSNLEMPPE